MENKSHWREPQTSAIYLLDGRIIEAHVNGKSEDGRSGYVYVEGKERRVYWFYDDDAVTMVNGKATITGSGKWYEQIEPTK